MSRYDTDRKLGYRDEAVGITDKPRVDLYAQEAEQYIADWLGITAQGDAGGRDPGWDLVFRGWRIDVKWTKYEPRGGKFPMCPMLMVPQWKPRRADIYVLVVGEWPDRFDRYSWCDGWQWRQIVEAYPVVDMGRARETSGKGAPCFATTFDYLRPMQELIDNATEKSK